MPNNTLFYLAVLFCICSCSNAQESAEKTKNFTKNESSSSEISAQFIVDNNKGNIDLLTKLPVEIQEKINWRVGSSPYLANKNMMLFGGKVGISKKLRLNGSVKSATMFTLNDAEDEKELSYQILKEKKENSFSKELHLYNDEGLPIQIQNVLYTYENGELTLKGKANPRTIKSASKI